MTIQPEQLHEDKFLRILGDEHARIIGIDWEEATPTMTSEEFNAVLTIFAGHVEKKNALGILVDVIKFRRRFEPQVQQWRGKNIPRATARQVCIASRSFFLRAHKSPR